MISNKRLVKVILSLLPLSRIEVFRLGRAMSVYSDMALDERLDFERKVRIKGFHLKLAWAMSVMAIERPMMILSFMVAVIYFPVSFLTNLISSLF